MICKIFLIFFACSFFRHFASEFPARIRLLLVIRQTVRQIHRSPARGKLYQSFQLTASNPRRIERAWNVAKNGPHLRLTQSRRVIQFDEIRLGGEDYGPLSDVMAVRCIPQPDGSNRIAFSCHPFLNFLRRITIARPL
jgi:hypothetical protein